MEEQINICPLLAIIDNSGTPNCVKENCAWWTVTGGCAIPSIAISLESLVVEYGR